MKAWSGRRVRLIVANVLATKGQTCWLCGYDGADSADHDPPRSVLVEQGVPDPDAMEYLNPAHRLPCNVMRQDQPVTEALRAACRAARAAFVEKLRPLDLSPRFAARRPDVFPTEANDGKGLLPRISQGVTHKNSATEEAL